MENISKEDFINNKLFPLLKVRKEQNLLFGELTKGYDEKEILLNVKYNDKLTQELYRYHNDAAESELLSLYAQQIEMEVLKEFCREYVLFAGNFKEYQGDLNILLDNDYNTIFTSIEFFAMNISDNKLFKFDNHYTELGVGVEKVGNIGEKNVIVNNLLPSDIVFATNLGKVDYDISGEFKVNVKQFKQDAILFKVNKSWVTL